MPTNNATIFSAAINVLQQASQGFGINASALKTDNYNRIWARDAAVSGLAILQNNVAALYKNVAFCITILQQNAFVNGQIPSNVAVDINGITTAVSFGGPVGRTDASFWWVILACQYYKKTSNAAIQELIIQQAPKIFTLATNWEFNGKHLMYLPISSNWADEYITSGYVLYDQLLRYWALQCYNAIHINQAYTTKAGQIKDSVLQHFCFVNNNAPTLFTDSQKNIVANFTLQSNFIASFTPGQIIDKYDCWSIGLLFYLKIINNNLANNLVGAIESQLAKNPNGLPAFWPLINQTHALYPQLKSNFSYRFKNKPGHFHNGGIWPVTNGFLAMGLMQYNHTKLANNIFTSIKNNLIIPAQNNTFAEYFSYNNNNPCGTSNLCFTAAGYLMAYKATQ